MIEINYPINYKITAFSKLKKETEEENFLNDCLLERKIKHYQDLNFINLIDNFNLSNNNISNNLLDFFFDGIGKFDNLSCFLKSRVYLFLLKKVGSFINNISEENYVENINKCNLNQIN